ncbi:MAG: viperin family antiviral radical SAM protein [Thermoplasmata archaeon]
MENIRKDGDSLIFIKQRDKENVERLPVFYTSYLQKASNLQREVKKVAWGGLEMKLEHRDKLMIDVRNCYENENCDVIIPPSVNWHITNRCNMNCVYCFAKFKKIDRILPKESALKIPRQLVELGIKKINISGGEPFLYPYLNEVIKECKKCGLTVAIISNGTILTSSLIKEISEYVDWLGLSLDSCNEETQTKLGRGKCIKIPTFLELAKLIKKEGIRLKINTVVTKLNVHEDMRELIKRINPDRWKVFQVMMRPGENDGISNLLVNDSEFKEYSRRNMFTLENGTKPAFESNEDMRTSYLMLDPLGRFFHSANGPIEYIDTDPLNIAKSKDKIVFDYDAYIRRGGIYDWDRQR